MTNCLILSFTLGLIVGTSMAMKENKFIEDFPLDKFQRIELSRARVAKYSSQWEFTGITFARELGDRTLSSSIQTQVAELMKEGPAIKNPEAMVAEAKKFFAAPYVTSVTFLESVSGEFGLGKTHHRPAVVKAIFSGEDQKCLTIRAKSNKFGSPAFTTFEVDLNRFIFPFSKSQTAEIFSNLAGTKVPDDIVGLFSGLESRTQKFLVTWNQDRTPDTPAWIIQEDHWDRLSKKGKILGPDGKEWATYKMGEKSNLISGFLKDPSSDRQLEFACDCESFGKEKEYHFVFKRDSASNLLAFMGSSKSNYGFTPEHFQQLARWVVPEKGEMHFEEQVLKKLMTDLSNKKLKVIEAYSTEAAGTPKKLIL